MKKMFQTSFLVLTVAYLAACGVEVKDNNGSGDEAATPQAIVGDPAADVYINEKRVLTGPLKLQGARILLGPQADIQTNEFPLEIECTELVSQGGTLRNFTDEARAAVDQYGREGGAIKIKAQVAKGVLNVLLKGENGGGGRPGVATNYGNHPGCAGTDGKKGGDAGSLIALFADSSQLQLQTHNEGGLFGPGGRRGSVPKGTANAVYPPCLGDSPEGQDGVSGKPGLVCVKLNQASELICNK